MDPHKMTHNKKTKKMTQADILFSVSDAPAFQTVALNNPQNTIAIDYCTGVVQGGTCTGTTETVTIQSDNSGNGIEINSPNRVIPPSNSNVVEFPPPPGRISKIRINTQGFECPSAGNGNCLLVIHYK